MREKKPQTAAGLFFSMLLRAAVIILGIAILAFGVFFVMQVVKGGGKSKAPATTLDANALTDSQVDELQGETTTQAQTEESSEGEESDSAEGSSDAKGRQILVLNSTDIAGLAGRWCDTLNADGYANTKASDYTETIENTKIVAREEGLGQELVNYFSNASYEVGTVTSGTTESTDGFDIVIIIGASDSDH